MGSFFPPKEQDLALDKTSSYFDLHLHQTQLTRQGHILTFTFIRQRRERKCEKKITMKRKKNLNKKTEKNNFVKKSKDI